MFANAASKWYSPSSNIWKKHVWNFYSYNCQAIPAHRPLSVILRKLPGDLVALQSTGSRWNWPTRTAEQSVWVHNVGQYKVYTWPLNPASTAITRSCGVIIALRRITLPDSAVVRVISPDDHLQGRIGGLRVRLRSGPDFTFFNLYFPTAKFPDSVKICREMYEWLRRQLETLPKRTVPVIFTDANARLGTSRLRNPEGQLLVGPFTDQRENSAGRMLRNNLQLMNMAALNSLYVQARGPTWYCTRGYAACIDYILAQPGVTAFTKSVKILRSLGHRLQLPNTEQMADHVPIRWALELPTIFPQGRTNDTWTRPQVDDFLSSTRDVESFCGQINEWAGEDSTIDSVKVAIDNLDVDDFYSLIHERVFATLDAWKPRRTAQKFPGESTATARLLARKWELKDQLATASDLSLVHFLQHQLLLSINLSTMPVRRVGSNDNIDCLVPCFTILCSIAVDRLGAQQGHLSNLAWAPRDAHIIDRLLVSRQWRNGWKG
eukprot:TRINITY_DN76778_c0_g1_i1.p1 TRINITY_DN76778_c0_g1~~TRINITY_DN76778_c0_g1_i1.p1  ORF type:complete len:492 (+),score=12.32 TRINITY_DN76778_c0_g1_i1:117-1592(+)